MAERKGKGAVREDRKAMVYEMHALISQPSLRTHCRSHV